MVNGLLYSKICDVEVIYYYYDVFNNFYEWVFGLLMIYMCVVFLNVEVLLE